MKDVIDNILLKNHQKKRRKQKRWIHFWQLVICASFIAFWQVASTFEWINPLIFSSPKAIIQLLQVKLSDGSIGMHIVITLLETIAGFLIGTVGGIMIATFLWSSQTLAKISDPYLVILNAMPKVALGPMIIVALGPSYLSIILMGAIISIIVTALVIFSAFHQVDHNYVKVMQTFGANKKQIFTQVVFPATIPAMIATFKVNVGLSWVGVIVGEFLVSNNGLGYLIIYGFQVFDFTLVLTSLVIIAILAACMYTLVEKLEKMIIKHS